MKEGDEEEGKGGVVRRVRKGGRRVRKSGEEGKGGW